MRVLAALAAAASLVALSVSNAPAGAADSCPSSGTLDVLPLHAPIGVHHKVDLVLIGKFDLRRLVPGSLSFHVLTPIGTRNFPGGDDTLGAIFDAPAVGSYTATAHWQLHSCDDPSVNVDESAGPEKFRIFHERRPRARFKATVVIGGDTRKAPIFQTTANCPPSTIGITERLELSVYFERGKKTPTHSSPHSSQVLDKGCAAPPGGPQPKSKNYSWGVVSGGTIGVLPGNTVRVLAEVKSGRKIVGQTRVRFQPAGGNREALFRDAGKCVGRCIKRIFKY
jgi:hypothetical protein